MILGYLRILQKGVGLFKFKTYEDISGKSNSLLTGENENNTELFINEIEVFKVS